MSTFKDKQAEVTPAIDEYLKEAKHNLDKAIALSEEYGVPFYSGITGVVSDWYVPSTVYEKNPGIDEDFLRGVAGIFSHNEYKDYICKGGWQTSYC